MRIFKLLSWLVLIPLILIFLAFSVANRGAVLVSFDPIPYATNMPLYLLVFTSILIGIVVGGFGAWWKAGRARRLARHRGYDVDDLKRELASVKAEHETALAELKTLRQQNTGDGATGRSLVKAA